MAINFTILTLLVGMFGVLFGSLMGPYLNNKINRRSQREELFFKKKLEYFEKITENIENNLRLYKSCIKKTETKKTSIKKTIEILKQERKNFLILSSPLYFDTTKLAEYIKKFVQTEKEIFSNFNKLELNKNMKKEMIINLNKQLENLKACGNSIVLEMKREIKN